jgi:dihydrofolate synthase/folylpolyglutamate synthase
VTTALDQRVLEIIAERARSVDAPLLALDRDFRASTGERTLYHQKICLEDAASSLNVTLPTGAEYGPVNAAAAFGAARTLQGRGEFVTDCAIVRGLESAKVPGRFEVVAASPLVILDGAQSTAGMRSLRMSLDAVAPGKRKIMLFTAMEDKNVDAMAGTMAHGIDTVVITAIPGERRIASTETLERAFAGKVPRVMVSEDPSEALHLALSEARSDGMVVVAGSLYLVGWARERLLGGQTCV